MSDRSAVVQIAGKQVRVHENDVIKGESHPSAMVTTLQSSSPLSHFFPTTTVTMGRAMGKTNPSL